MMWRYGVAGVAIGMLAGCAGVVTVSNIYQVEPYSQSLVQHVAAPGEVAVEVAGNAFADPPADYREEIAASLSLPGWLPPARLTTRPSERARASQRIVLAFNPERVLGDEALCGRIGEVAFAAYPGRTRVQVAMCAGDRLVASVRAEVPAAAGPGDPAFDDFLDQVMLNLLPPREPFLPPTPCAGAPGC